MLRFIGSLFGVLFVAACLAAPIAVAVSQQRHVKNFHVVRDGVLYRSAQLTPEGLKRVVHDNGIRTVINLREGTTANDVAEARFCAAQEINFVRLLPRCWEMTDGKAEVDENVRAFLDVVRDPKNHPVLIHCFAGIHRTGAYCAVYRMECEGWDNARAVEELKAFGYDNFDNEADIKGYLANYRKGRLDNGSPPSPPTLSELEGLRSKAVAADLHLESGEAIRLYEELARRLEAGDMKAAMEARRRANFLRAMAEVSPDKKR